LNLRVNEVALSITFDRYKLLVFEPTTLEMNESSVTNNMLVRRVLASVDLRHLHCAVAADEHGSFRKAADSLLLRQSTLSRCVTRLENTVGLTIFERSKSGARATQAGRYFLRTARSILEQMDALVTHTYSTGRGEVGRLTVGIYTSLSAGNLRATLADFKQRFPNIELVMAERSRSLLLAALRNGALDVAIVTGDAPIQENKALLLWSERTLVALPETHSLVDQETVHWTDLQSEPLLLSNYDYGQEFENLLLSKLVYPEDKSRIRRHDVSRGMIKSLVSLGFGISIVTESDIGARFSGLTYRELRDGKGPSRIGYSAHWRTDNDNPALASFLRILRERYPPPAV
jgi:DNA-binding transcriptional LysR family regulator